MSHPSERSPMDVPVVLCHRTAWQLYHAPRRQEAMSAPGHTGIMAPGLKASQAMARVREVLLGCGITPEDAATIDILVPFVSQRCRTRGTRSHVFGRLIREEMIAQVAEGVWVTNAALTFVQAAAWADPLELLEFGYEACGSYETSLGAGDAYRTRPALATRADITGYLGLLGGANGVCRARRTFSLVREGSRSPMETALAIMLALPRAQGGMGLADFSMNHRVDMPASMRTAFSSSFLELDLYFPKAGLALEYDGESHAELKRRTHDADRVAALSMLGIRVRTITSRHFSHKLEMHRALNGIAQLLGAAPDTTAEFQEAQDALRKRVIRHWAQKGAH